MALAVAPGFLLMLYFYKRDTHEPEPQEKVAQMMGWGALCVIPALILELMAPAIFPFVSGDNLISIAINAYLVVAVAEELCKFIAVKKKIYDDPELDEPYDGVVYCVATSLGFAIVENVQRSDLNPVEEAMGYQQLIDEHSYTQADLAQVIGKSRSHVANTLRLLKLPEDVRTMLVSGDLSAGHARTLITAEDPTGLARRIVREGLSVRQAEALQQGAEKGGATRSEREKPQKDADTLALERLVGDALGMKVTITHEVNGGQLKIAYKNLEQLDEVCRRLQR